MFIPHVEAEKRLAAVTAGCALPAGTHSRNFAKSHFNSQWTFSDFSISNTAESTNSSFEYPIFLSLPAPSMARHIASADYNIGGWGG